MTGVSTAPLSEPASGPAAAALEDHAIVVGINDYGGNFPELEGAVNDALFFRRWLVADDGGRVPPRNVQLFLSPRGGRPDARTATRDTIVDGFKSLLPAALAPGPVGRRLYLFFSGHGATPHRAAEICALLAENADRLSMERHVPGAQLATVARRARFFEEIVLLMDCCRDSDVNCPQAPLGFAAMVREAQHFALCVTGFATRWNRKAREVLLPAPDGGDAMQGLFTHALLEGLRLAERNDQGALTSHALEKYVEERVTALAIDHGVAFQKPDMDFRDQLVFGPARATTLSEVRIQAPEDATITVRDGLLELVACERTFSAGVHVLRLRPSRLYSLEVEAADGTVLFDDDLRVLEEVHHVL